MLGAVSAHYYYYCCYYRKLTFCVSLHRHIPLPSFLQTVDILSSSSIAVTRFLHSNVTIKKIYCSKTESEDGHSQCLIQAVSQALARGSLRAAVYCKAPSVYFGRALVYLGVKQIIVQTVNTACQIITAGPRCPFSTPPPPIFVFLFCSSLVHTSFLVVIAAVKWASFIAA